MLYYLMQPVKIIDPHLVSLFFDNYKRVYLHATTELENRRAWVAECSLNIQVTTGVEGNIFFSTASSDSHLSFPAGSHMQYTFPEVSDSIHSYENFEKNSLFQLASFLSNSKFKILLFY